MNAVAAAVVALLAAAATVLPLAPAVPPADDGPVIELTAKNWGRQASLTDPDHPVYAHLFARSAVTTVTATIHFDGPRPRGFTATLDDPEAYNGLQAAPCTTESAPALSICQFTVAVGGGVNHLTLTVSFPGGSDIVATGEITGGALDYTSTLQARDAAGIWQRIPDGGDLELPSELFSSVRYVIGNTGGVPFRVTGACTDGEIEPGSSIDCLVTGPRPIASLEGGYGYTFDLEDPVGAIGSTHADGLLRASRTSFRVDHASVVVGQRIALEAQGVDERDLGVVLVRVGSRPVRLSPESTPDRIVFSTPFVEPGVTNLDVLLSGVTVQRLQLVVTAKPQKPPVPGFPVGLVIILAIGGALVGVIVWRATMVRGHVA